MFIPIMPFVTHNIGKVEKVGEQTSVLEYIKQNEK